MSSEDETLVSEGGGGDGCLVGVSRVFEIALDPPSTLTFPSLPTPICLVQFESGVILPFGETLRLLFTRCYVRICMFSCLTTWQS